MAAYDHSETPFDQNLSINIRTATPPCDTTEIAWYGKAPPGQLSPITDAGSSGSEASGLSYSPVDSLGPAMPNVSFAPTPDWLSPHASSHRAPTSSGRRNRSVSDPPPCSPQDNYPPIGRARASTVTNRQPFPEPHIPAPGLPPEIPNIRYPSHTIYPSIRHSPYPSIRQPDGPAYANLGGLYYPSDEALTPTPAIYPDSSPTISSSATMPTAPFEMLSSGDTMTPTLHTYPTYVHATPSPLPPWNLHGPAPPVIASAGDHDVDGVAQTTTWLSRFDLSSRSSSAGSMRQPATNTHGYNEPAPYASESPSSTGHPGRASAQLNRSQIGTEAMTRKSNLRRKQEARFHCPQTGCLKSFTRSHNLRNHLRSHEQKKAFACPMCALRFNNPGVRDYHKKRCRGAASEVE
ncbi:hypothetical protein HDZ31DRAFT_46966 [Schizophyllum fasciatum]